MAALTIGLSGMSSLPTCLSMLPLLPPLYLLPLPCVLSLSVIQLHTQTLGMLYLIYDDLCNKYSRPGTVCKFHFAYWVHWIECSSCRHSISIWAALHQLRLSASQWIRPLSACILAHPLVVWVAVRKSFHWGPSQSSLHGNLFEHHENLALAVIKIMWYWRLRINVAATWLHSKWLRSFTWFHGWLHFTSLGHNQVTQSHSK
jgi:hypothetical protein